MPGERTARRRVDPALQQEIEQFLYFEAELLDDSRLHEWLELFADDIRYVMPIRQNRLRRERGLEVGTPDDIAYFDEDKTSLKARVKRLDTGMAWAEDPPSRTRHLVSNVQIEPAGDDAFHVLSCFLLYRSRLRTDENIFAGRRHDLLRRVGDGWQIARREILLDQNVILAKNLSVFF